MIIVTFGALGAVAAFLVSKNGQFIGDFISNIIHKPVANWQVAYIVGGTLGLLLLALRASTFESGLFEQAKEHNVERGNFFSLFKQKETFVKYLACIVIGLPVWFVVGVLIALAHRFLPEITGNTDILKVLPTKEMVLWSYVGLSIGDLTSGTLSQIFKSRKKVMFSNIIGIIIMTLIYLYGPVGSANYYRFIAVMLGAVTGYWALFVTNASEQFGTNIRSTVAATVPNFVRGGVLLITSGFEILESQTHSASISALIVGIICVSLAIWGTLHIEESFHKDLNYYEK